MGVYCENMRRPPFVGASNAQLGAWTRLHVAAGDIEQDGVIPSCVGFDDRRWLALAQVTRADVEDAIGAGLARWEGNDLVVQHYDVEGQMKVRTARANGRKSGGRPTAKPKGKPRQNRADNPRVSPGVSHEQPEPKPLSGSVTSAVTKTKERGPDSLSCAAILTAFEEARRDRELPAAIPSGEEVAALESALDSLSADARAAVPRLVPKFFGRNGNSPDDAFWKRRNWSLGVFIEQALPFFLSDRTDPDRVPSLRSMP